MKASIGTIQSTSLALLAALMTASCALMDPENQSDSGKRLIGAGTAVPAAAETQSVATQRGDAADDPEIWVDPKDSNRAVIFGTDKQAGLYSYDLSGQQIGFIPDGRLNNVDLRGGLMTPQGERVLVGASDRDRMGAAFYLLDPATLNVTPWGLAKLDLSEPYGFCMGRRQGAFIAIINGTDGQVRQVQISAGPDGGLIATEERRFDVGSQTEGCVVDDQKSLLYIGEESVGVWRYDLDPTSTNSRILIAGAPSTMLQPDVEGIALLREGPKTWLIVSSQGDSAFGVWRVDGTEPDYRGRFSVVSSDGIDGVTGTDGVAAIGGNVGPYREGLVVVQDDIDDAGDTPTTNRLKQNFKLVDWRSIKSALKIDETNGQ